MDTRGKLVAGSHNRNEFVLINADKSSRIKSMQELSGQICQICGGEIEITVDGDPFVACNECAFPVCRPCYEYGRREGNQACPQCKSESKVVLGLKMMKKKMALMIWTMSSIMVILMLWAPHQVAESVLSARLNVVRGSNYNCRIPAHSEHDSSPQGSEIPLLTYGEEDSEISSDRHALIVPPYMGHGNRVHPLPFSDPSSLQPRPMVPKKAIAVYGYGSVAWKDRMEEWKKSQNEKLQVVKHEGVSDVGNFGGNDELDDPDLPMYEKEGKPSELASVDIFVSTVDPMKEPPPITANTVLSILVVDYPVGKVACYVSDDGAAMLTFEALS